MTPEEIRDLGLMEVDGEFESEQAVMLWSCARFLREIAAQLAELNKRLTTPADGFPVYLDGNTLEVLEKIAEKLGK